MSSECLRYSKCIKSCLFLKRFPHTSNNCLFLLLFRLTNQVLPIKHVALLSQADSSGLHLHRGSWSGSIPAVNPHDAVKEVRLGGEIGLWCSHNKGFCHPTWGGLSLSGLDLPGVATEGQDLHIPSSGDQSLNGELSPGRSSNLGLSGCLLLRAIPRKGFS